MSLASKDLKIAVKAVRFASEATKFVNSPSAIIKSDSSPVTIADYASQIVIMSILQENGNADFIAEEDDKGLSNDTLEKVEDVVKKVLPNFKPNSVKEVLRRNVCTSNSQFWTIDPIDGTKGYLRGDQYAICLAKIFDGKVQVAAMCCPNLDGGIIFFAERDRGAYQMKIDEEDISAAERIYCHPRETEASVLCESYESAHSSHSDSGNLRKDLNISKDSIRMDSQCKYGLVANGKANIFFRRATKENYYEKIWDHAAGALIVQEAGGIVSHLNGDPLVFTNGPLLNNGSGILATSDDSLHSKIVQYFKEKQVNKA
ncbi:3(2),5-bisphosphate nucleotidase HAL2 [Rozella allomycis CSF55]|uniref:3'(2'),5'-bisphosphate nucleotidase n=1 Tax=Rozella allomycis (strain CSF55) TaxID=988480 RepID=A0A4P9YQL8_ROZAC|nr:3(2),5-bisphosphate nucleotidase HAL2 [Rozella allomycis CSF55]